MLVTSARVDVRSLCPVQLQFQDGPNGFGNSYRKGNRIFAKHDDAFSADGVHYDSKQFNGKLELGFTMRSVDDIPGNVFKYTLMLRNDDVTLRHMQLAFLENWRKSPGSLHY